MYFKQKFGKNGEDLAEAYLKLINYKILEKNFRCFRGEIDLIALTGDKSKTWQKVWISSRSSNREKT